MEPTNLAETKHKSCRNTGPENNQRGSLFNSVRCSILAQICNPGWMRITALPGGVARASVRRIPEEGKKARKNVVIWTLFAVSCVWGTAVFRACRQKENTMCTYSQFRGANWKEKATLALRSTHRPQAQGWRVSIRELQSDVQRLLVKSAYELNIPLSYSLSFSCSAGHVYTYFFFKYTWKRGLAWARLL